MFKMFQKIQKQEIILSREEMERRDLETLNNFDNNHKIVGNFVRVGEGYLKIGTISPAWCFARSMEDYLDDSNFRCLYEQGYRYYVSLQGRCHQYFFYKENADKYLEKFMLLAW